MDDIYETLRSLGRHGDRVALATLVATHGTSPRKEGAKMWVGPGGRVLGSVTIGGCVDARVIRESEGVLRDASRKLLSIPLGDEDAQELGLTCAGSVDLLLEAIRPAREGDAVAAVYEAVHARVQSGGRAVSVKVLPDARGALPSAVVPPGALAVLDNGSLHGSLGTPALDTAARETALLQLRSGESRTLPLTAGGEEISAFFEVHGRGPLLVIVGAGAVAMPLCSMAKQIGLHVIVIDGRERFATQERFPDADRLLVGMPSEIAAGLDYDASSAVVVVAHDYKYDVPVLASVLVSPAGYVGMLGNPRRGEQIKQMLREDGVPEDAIARLYTPVGLDIGARTTSEIALAVLAELLAVRNQRMGGPLRDRRSP